MAELTHFSKSYLGNVETGLRTLTPDVVLGNERAIGPVGDDMLRRDITHPGFTKVRGTAKVAALSRAIEQGEPGFVANVPTVHSTALAIAQRAGNARPLKDVHPRCSHSRA